MKAFSLSLFLIICLSLLNCSEENEEPNLFKPGNGVTDVDGNSYPSIVLGEQEWMASNLKTSKYSNGEAITNVTGDTWGSVTSGSWCYYNNDGLMNDSYGKLYNFYAVIDGRNICPSGWHIPDDFDWSKLIQYLGDEGIAGGRMKEVGTTHWNAPNSGATNESGFTGVAGGNRRGAINSVFETFGTMGRYWSSSQVNADAGWGYDLATDAVGIGRNQFNKGYGFSCRCIKD